MIIRLFIFQHAYMAPIIYKCAYKCEDTFSQMRKYFIARAFWADKSAWNRILADYRYNKTDRPCKVFFNLKKSRVFYFSLLTNVFWEIEAGSGRKNIFEVNWNELRSFNTFRQKWSFLYKRLPCIALLLPNPKKSRVIWSFTSHS